MVRRGGPISFDGATLRVAYATWGQNESSCHLTINSVEVPLVAQPPQNATQLRPGDFDGNVAVESFSLAGANTSGTYSRYTDGWLFAMLVPQKAGERLTPSFVDGPDGEHQECWCTIHQQTTGTWTYTIGTSARAERGPTAVLWLIELPD